jgi:cytochrome d ubiquinol oxidase subunit I
MQKVYEYQPEKLAAAEGLFETQDHAPLALGGFTDEKEQRVKYGIEFPWMLSFLSGNSFNTVITGLNDFPRDYWPPLFVHTLFNGMVIIGSILILVALVGVVWYKFLKKKSFPKIFMWAFVATGPLAIIGIGFSHVPEDSPGSFTASCVHQKQLPLLLICIFYFFYFCLFISYSWPQSPLYWCFILEEIRFLKSLLRKQIKKDVRIWVIHY